MADQVSVPGLGKVPKQTAEISLAVVAALIVVYYVRKKSSTATTAAPTATDQYPPDGTTGNPSDPYSTDPATGQTYGDEAAGSGLAGAYGTGGAYGFGGTGYNPTTGLYTDPNGNTCSTPDADGYCPNTGGSGGQQGPPFSSNSDWESWALTQLQQQDPGIDSGALLSALGLYLNGQPVSAAQKTLVFDATGIAGDPPVAGPNNYPPNVRTDGSTGPSPGPVPGATVTVPDVIGLRTEAEAVPKIKDDGLVPHIGGGFSPSEADYVTSQTPGVGKKVAKGSTVDLGSGRTPPKK